MEFAGLVFGVLGALDICIKVSKEVNGLVRQFKTVGLDFEWASDRLDIHNEQFKSWVEFWDIKESTPTRWFHSLWGPEGTNAIMKHLKGLSELYTKATDSQKKYKRTLEKVSKPKRFQLFRGKVRYTFSGKDELEGYLNKLRTEFGFMEREADEFFFRRHHNASRGSISKSMVDGLVKESAMMDHVMKIQQAAMHLFNRLDMNKLPLPIDLSLQSDYVSKNQFREWEFDTQKLHKKSTKLPIVLDNAHMWIFPPRHFPSYPQLVFVLEAGEECSFETPPGDLQEGNLHSIVSSILSCPRTVDSHINLSYNESFLLGCPPNAFKYEEYRFIAHTTLPNDSISAPRPLNELFDNLPRHINKYPSRPPFPITWQLELAHTLAASVLNLQGTGWLDALHSRNIYQRENLHKSTIHSLRVDKSDTDSYSRRTPLDEIFHRPKNPSALKPEIFLLGILLLEIGLARSGSAIFRDLENIKTPEEKLAMIYYHLDHSVCPPYTDVTKACLEGDFEFDEDMDPQKILASYISKVLVPLKIQRDTMSGDQSSHQWRKTTVPPKIMKQVAPKEIHFPEWNNFEGINIKGRSRTSTWGENTFPN